MISLDEFSQLVNGLGLNHATPGTIVALFNKYVSCLLRVLLYSRSCDHCIKFAHRGTSAFADIPFPDLILIRADSSVFQSLPSPDHQLRMCKRKPLFCSLNGMRCLRLLMHYFLWSSIDDHLLARHCHLLEGSMAAIPLLQTNQPYLVKHRPKPMLWVAGADFPVDHNYVILLTEINVFPRRTSIYFLFQKM